MHSTPTRPPQPAPRLTSPVSSDEDLISRDERRARNLELTRQLAAVPAADRSDLREQLILNNLVIASAIAGRMARRSRLREDLEQVARMALVAAAHNFDPHRGHAFLAYAVPCMAGAIKRYMRDTAWTVRPPRSLQEEHVRDRNEDNDTTNRVDLESCWRPVSLDALAAGTSVSLGATIPDTGGRSALSQADDRLVLMQALRELTTEARRMLYLRFYEDRTQREIGVEFGISQYHVSRLLSRALSDLRSKLTSPGDLPAERRNEPVPIADSDDTQAA